MDFKLSKRLIATFFALCMIISLIPMSTFAAEGDTNITEVNINGVSNELWSYKDVTFATVDESSNYTIQSQKWTSTVGNITPSDTNLKPKSGQDYSFIINLNAKDGYVFPTKSESNVFYNGVFKVNGNEYDNPVVTVTSDGKTIIATLFPLTKVKGVTDIPGGSNTEVETTVRNNYTDCEVTDDINLKKGSDYIIDFTKEDNLSMALRSMADLEGTKYYKFANSDKNSLIETEDVSEALIKIVGNKAENKAIMSLLSDVDTDTSYELKFMRTQYTGSKLTYTGTDYPDEGTGKTIINEIRDDYYTRYHFNCNLNLIANTQPSNSIELVEINDATVSFKPGDKPVFTGKIPEGANYSYQCEWWETDDEKTGVNSEEFWDRNYENHITSFESGKTYKYGLYLKANEGYHFTENTKLKINGVLYDYKRSENDSELSHPDNMSTMWVYTDLKLILQTKYIIIEGANSSWVQNTDGTLTFRIDGDISKFVGIKIDGSWIDSENYTTASGSTVVTLKNEFLKNLSANNHNITFVYTDGEVSTNFEIKNSKEVSEEVYENSDNPKTGDNSNIFLWTLLFSVSILVIIEITIYNRKKKSIV